MNRRGRAVSILAVVLRVGCNHLNRGGDCFPKSNQRFTLGKKPGVPCKDGKEDISL